MKSKTYSRRTGFRSWLHGKSVPLDEQHFSASQPPTSPLTGPAESQTTPTVPPASAITAGEASRSHRFGNVTLSFGGATNNLPAA